MNKSTFGNFIPTITMLIIGIIIYFSDSKDLFIIGITYIIPISFFVEGIICSKKEIKWQKPFILSLSIFSTMNKIIISMWDVFYIHFMNKIMISIEEVYYICFIYYFLAYMSGYVLSEIILLLKRKKV